MSDIWLQDGSVLHPSEALASALRTPQAQWTDEQVKAVVELQARSSPPQTLPCEEE